MKSYFIAIATTLITALFGQNAIAQTSPQYALDKKIALAGDGGYDYLYIDQENRRLYVSHGNTVQVINLETETLVGTIEGMQGNHGIAIAPTAKLGFITDGKANAVVVFNLTTLNVVKTIALNGKKPDAIIYDAFSNQVFAFNGSSNNTSVINVTSLKEVATIALDGGPEYAVTNGKGMIFNNIEDKNVLKVIDTKQNKVVNTYPLSPCGGPTGLALDVQHNRLFSACRENKGMSVLDATSGKVISTMPIGAGVDAVAYDAATRLVFCSNGDGTTTIFKQKTADTYELAQTLTTQLRAKTLALDTKTHKIYLSAYDLEPGTTKPIAGTFKVLVYKMIGK